MWEEKHGILLSSSEVGGFGRAFLSGVLGAEGEEKYCLKKRTLTPKQASWLAREGFSISRDYIIMHSYTGFCYRRTEESWRVRSSQGAKIRGLCTSSFFYGTFQDVRNSDLLYPVGSSFAIGTIMLEGKPRKMNDKS